jgi:hypothetical protein
MTLAVFFTRPHLLAILELLTSVTFGFPGLPRFPDARTSARLFTKIAFYPYQEFIIMLSPKTKPATLAVIFMLFTTPVLEAGWNDWYKKLEDAIPAGTPAGGVTENLSQTEIVAGLKEALNVGVERATTLLGSDGGFLNDAKVRIPMPETLQQVEKGLRAAGQDALADDFVTSMNRAAEKAVPETTAILAETIKNMSLEDARGILDGPDDAATQYFRKNKEAQLTSAILPIVEDTTAQTGVTSAYKQMTGNLGFLSQFTGQENLDLDRYVAGKTLDGLFLKLAEEEKLIRQDPLARSTELLKKVFAGSP